jgi:hypothetical protein
MAHVQKMVFSIHEGRHSISGAFFQEATEGDFSVGVPQKRCGSGLSEGPKGNGPLKQPIYTAQAQSGKSQS